jgi:hypothetical protein
MGDVGEVRVVPQAMSQLYDELLSVKKQLDLSAPKRSL